MVRSTRPLAEDISRANSMESMVKDSKRFASTNKWSFFTFGHQAPPYSPSAKVMPAAQCASCHIVGVAETDMVWVQYYPLLRAKLQ
jgi:Cytochrome P460